MDHTTLVLQQPRIIKRQHIHRSLARVVCLEIIVKEWHSSMVASVATPYVMRRIQPERGKIDFRSSGKQESVK